MIPHTAQTRSRKWDRSSGKNHPSCLEPSLSKRPCIIDVYKSGFVDQNTTEIGKDELEDIDISLRVTRSVPSAEMKI